MNAPQELHPTVTETGDGERSSAGSNYGDWRPAQRPRPHGYDFESRFVPPSKDPDFEPHAGSLPAAEPAPRPAGRPDRQDRQAPAIQETPWPRPAAPSLRSR